MLSSSKAGHDHEEVSRILERFEVLLEPDILERLALRLEVLSSELSNKEWAHLVGLLGLASAVLYETVSDPASRFLPEHVEPEDMGTPGFADVLSPAADVVLRQISIGCSVVITGPSSPGGWETTSSILKVDRSGAVVDGVGRNSSSTNRTEPTADLKGDN